MHWFNTVKHVSITDKQMSTSVYHFPTLSEGSVYQIHWPSLSVGICVPLANFVGGICVPLTKFVRGTCVPLANFVRGICGPLANFVRGICVPLANFVKGICGPLANFVNGDARQKGSIIRLTIRPGNDSYTHRRLATLTKSINLGPDLLLRQWHMPKTGWVATDSGQHWAGPVATYNSSWLCSVLHMPNHSRWVMWQAVYRHTWWAKPTNIMKCIWSYKLRLLQAQNLSSF